MITIIKIISYLFILESLFVLFLSLENDRNNAKKYLYAKFIKVKLDIVRI